MAKAAAAGGQPRRIFFRRVRPAPKALCPKPCGCFPRIETSWQIVLTVLTVVCPFSTPALILIVRLPARPSRLKDISMPSTRSKVCGTTQAAICRLVDSQT
jgi:hypothetical protein